LKVLLVKNLVEVTKLLTSGEGEAAKSEGGT